jgi:hypothetical protein
MLFFFSLNYYLNVCKMMKKATITNEQHKTRFQLLFVKNNLLSHSLLSYFFFFFFFFFKLHVYWLLICLFAGQRFTLDYIFEACFFLLIFIFELFFSLYIKRTRQLSAYMIHYYNTLNWPVLIE